MKKMVLLQDEYLPLDEIRKLMRGWEIIVSLTPEELKSHMPQAEILAGWSHELAADCLASDSLKWVQLWFAGVESLPLAEMKKKGIYLTNASGVHEHSISESMFAMMLAFARGLTIAMPDQMAGLWARSQYAPTEIHGKTLGILGVGAIGTEAARLGKAFGMRVLGLRRSGGDSPHVDRMYRMEQIDALLAECDCVMNVLPHTPETHQLMNAERFAAMKRGACYISAGRGKTTDQTALIAALQDGQLAFAGLDVTDPEPLPPDNPLWGMRNVIITPHISGMTDQYARRAYEIFENNLRSYLQTGRPAQNVVNYDHGY